MKTDDDNIQVMIRVRPLNSRELNEGSTSCVILPSDNPSQILLDQKPNPKKFNFDYVAGSNLNQEQIFNIVGKPLTQACLKGYNCCIFAYGQTGAGKTFTMQGRGLEQEGFGSADRGLQPRVFDFMFGLINQLKNEGEQEVEYLINCSYLEIYNEKIMDLLSENHDTDQQMQVREDLKKGVYVENLTEYNATNSEEAINLLLMGSKSRHVGSTQMNSESSRSHSVFSMNVESKTIINGSQNVKISKLHFVDLAGSERQKSTLASGDRLKEATNINKSLTSLGLVINSLVLTSSGKSKHIPYRDSKLTFILKDSLGGNSRTFMIAAISSASSSFQETLSTLKFAERAKQIKNKAQVNEDFSGNVESLKKEIFRLKDELTSCQKLLQLEREKGFSDQIQFQKHSPNKSCNPNLDFLHNQKVHNSSRIKTPNRQEPLLNMATLSKFITQWNEKLDNLIEFVQEKIENNQNSMIIEDDCQTTINNNSNIEIEYEQNENSDKKSQSNRISIMKQISSFIEEKEEIINQLKQFQFQQQLSEFQEYHNHQEAQTLQHTIDDQNIKIVQLQQQIDDFDNTLSQKQQKYQENQHISQQKIEQQERDIEFYKNQYSDLITSIEEMQAQKFDQNDFSNLQIEIKNLSQKNNELQYQIEQQSQKLNISEDQQQTYLKRNETLTDDISNQKKEKHLLEEQILKMKNQIIQLNSEKDYLFNEYNALQSENNQQNLQLMTNNDLLNQFKEANYEFEQKIENLSTNILVLNEHLVLKKQSFEDIENEKQRLAEEIDTMNETINFIQSSLDQKNIEIGELHLENLHEKNKIKNYENEIESIIELFKIEQNKLIQTQQQTQEIQIKYEKEIQKSLITQTQVEYHKQEAKQLFEEKKSNSLVIQVGYQILNESFNQTKIEKQNITHQLRVANILNEMLKDNLETQSSKNKQISQDFNTLQIINQQQNQEIQNLFIQQYEQNQQKTLLLQEKQQLTQELNILNSEFSELSNQNSKLQNQNSSQGNQLEELKNTIQANNLQIEQLQKQILQNHEELNNEKTEKQQIFSEKNNYLNLYQNTFQENQQQQEKIKKLIELSYQQEEQQKLLSKQLNETQFEIEKQLEQNIVFQQQLKIEISKSQKQIQQISEKDSIINHQLSEIQNLSQIQQSLSTQLQDIKIIEQDLSQKLLNQGTQIQILQNNLDISIQNESNSLENLQKQKQIEQNLLQNIENIQQSEANLIKNIDSLNIQINNFKSSLENSIKNEQKLIENSENLNQKILQQHQTIEHQNQKQQQLQQNLENSQQNEKNLQQSLEIQQQIEQKLSQNLENLNSIIITLKQEIQDYNDQICQQKELFKQKNCEVQQLQEKIMYLEEEMQAINNDFDEQLQKQAIVYNLEVENSKIAAASEQSTQQLKYQSLQSEKDQTINQLSESIKKHEQTIKELQIKNNSSNSQIHAEELLKERNEEILKLNNQIQSEKKYFEKELKDYMTITAQLQQQVQKQSNGKFEQYEAEGKYTQTKKNLDEFQTKLNEVENQNFKQKQEIRILNFEKGKNKETIENLQKEQIRLKNENQLMTEKLKIAQQTQKNFQENHLNNQKKEIESKINRVCQDCETYKQKLAKTINHKQNFSNMSEEIIKQSQKDLKQMQLLSQESRDIKMQNQQLSGELQHIKTFFQLTGEVLYLYIHNKQKENWLVEAEITYLLQDKSADNQRDLEIGHKFQYINKLEKKNEYYQSRLSFYEKKAESDESINKKRKAKFPEQNENFYQENDKQDPIKKLKI